jgi:hypothetical protein
MTCKPGVPETLTGLAATCDTGLAWELVVWVVEVDAGAALTWPLCMEVTADRDRG